MANNIVRGLTGGKLLRRSESNDNLDRVSRQSGESKGNERNQCQSQLRVDVSAPVHSSAPVPPPVPRRFRSNRSQIRVDVSAPVHSSAPVSPPVPRNSRRSRRFGR